MNSIKAFSVQVVDGFVCFFSETYLQDVLLQESPAAVVLRSLLALLSGATLWTAD